MISFIFICWTMKENLNLFGKMEYDLNFDENVRQP